MMEFEKAREIFNSTLSSAVHGTYHSEEEIKEAEDFLLQDAYEFLESENFHTAILVIEKLTGKEMK